MPQPARVCSTAQAAIVDAGDTGLGVECSASIPLRRPMIPALTALLLAAATATPADVPSDETPIVCDACADWNGDQAPFRIIGNTYYVGVHGVAAVLIKTRAGLILLDGGLPQSVPLIIAHIRALGFHVSDVRWILSSHAHFDHAGGIAALQRISGANVAASTLAAPVLQTGLLPHDDPQYDAGKGRGFPPVAHVSPLLDGESITLGEVTVTAHYTPGHTPGGVTWTWQSCGNLSCQDIVYADSLNAAPSGNFRFDDPAHHPDPVRTLRHSIAVVRALRCDVVISVHPGFTDVFAKAAANSRDPTRNAFVDATGCRAYADAASAGLDAELKREATAVP